MFLLHVHVHTRVYAHSWLRVTHLQCVLGERGRRQEGMNIAGRGSERHELLKAQVHSDAYITVSYRGCA